MAGYEKPDFWAQKAQKEGYPARSVYKLEEINEKFSLIKKGMRILDIGAAPGSWSLWTLKKMNASGFICAVDLDPLSIKGSPENFFFMQGDIYDLAVRAEMRSHGPYNLVMSDAAPKTTGNRIVDTGRSFALVEEVLSYGEEMLCAGGNLVVKVFQGGDEAELLKRLQGTFKSARSYKPKACRTSSFETYLLGLTKLKSS